jgi:lactate permease
LRTVTNGGAGGIDVVSWALAATPIVVLLALVVLGRTSAWVNGFVALACAVAVGVLAFGAGPAVVAVGAVKGVWTGLWILLVVWAALLVFHLTRQMGLMRLGDLLSSILPREVENVLIVAWIFPSLIQGVAGFGTPIAVAAPLLVTMGIAPIRAVALPLVGYHWAVGFGSMGSSFYMGALTARLDAAETAAYATEASVLLGLSALVSGLLVCLVHSGLHGLRQGWRLVVVAGVAMAGVQALTVQLEPAIGAVTGASAGLVVVALWRLVTRRSRVQEPVSVTVGSPVAAGRTTTTDDPDDDTPLSLRAAGLVLVPYAVLIAAVLMVYVPHASRSWVEEHLLIGPHLPETRTDAGVVNGAVGPYTPIALLGHPAPYLLLAAVAALLIWRLLGSWPPGRLGPAVQGWWRQSLKSSPAVLLLATVATVMTDTGLVRTIAEGAAEVTGRGFPLVSPLIGTVGAFTTGSTTSANALFAGLQAEVAGLIDVPASALVAAGLAGGNIGNIVAPMVVAIGVTGVSIRGQEGQVFRLVVLPAAVLLVVVTIAAALIAGTAT